MTVCRNCPFRAGSTLGYDADAIEALDSGLTPSCHVQVGTEQIFQDDEKACAGFQAWLEDRPGFRKPFLVEP